ncbi:uncharacterized protein LOC125426986 [Sphaerodactylus townsendi]|uniref:uncharacterized protein LOC125426986 n=1 Tax=Sphaerodactylus townsendi TaxID=933632 RepID=UPI002026CD0C|nr:uncharacterized protein LOC125426986 [Sphaerodactylus townsendi]
MPNQKSFVWHHYTEITDGRKIVGICKYCGQTYANNATRMKKHLTTCRNCPEEIQSLYRKLLPSGEKITVKKLFQQSQELSSSNRTANLPNVKMERPELQGPREREAGPSFSRSVSEEDLQTVGICLKQPSGSSNRADKMSKEDKEKADETLARAIFASGAPLSITENPYWKEHYKLICPWYKLPSHYRLSHSLLDREYGRVQTMVVQRLGQAESLTLMSDGWADMQGKSLLNIMFATPKPVFLKAIASKSSRHMSNYIAKVLSGEIQSAGPSKVLALVTDGGANMKGAWQILKAKYPHLIVFGCVAHGLNLLAEDILSLNTMKTIAANCKAIAKVFNNHVASQTLKIFQREKQRKESLFSWPAGTRWGSIAKCLDSLLHLKDCLQSALTGDTLSHVVPVNIRKQILDNDIFWVQVEGAFNLLLPISAALQKLEGENNLSSVTGILGKLNASLIDLLPSSPLSKNEAAAVKQMFLVRSEFCSHPVHLAANLLDPRQRAQNLSEDELFTALDTIMEVAKSVPNLSELTVMTDLAEYRAKEKLWSKDIIWKVAENVSPLTWWKGYCSTRQLSTIAVRILSIPPAILHESNWRASSSLKTQRGNRLTRSHAAKLLCINQNLSLSSQNQLYTPVVKQTKCSEWPTDSVQAETSFSDTEGNSSSSELDSLQSELETAYVGSTSTESDHEAEGTANECSALLE